MTKDEALKLALDALQKIYIAPEHEEYIRVWWPACEQAIPAIKEALAQPEQKCWCTTCRPITMTDMRFVVCPDCGNKRCPKANDHRNACTNSNEVGQKGSSWEHVKPLAQPEQEPVGWFGYDQGTSIWFETNKGEDNSVPLYTTPPQRTAEQSSRTLAWIGLTLEDKEEYLRQDFSGNRLDAMDWAARKLKEKNSA